jgi:hypothetical protein
MTLTLGRRPPQKADGSAASQSPIRHKPTPRNGIAGLPGNGPHNARRLGGVGRKAAQADVPYTAGG